MKIRRDEKNISFKYATGRSELFGRMFHGYYEIYLLLKGNVEYVNTHMRRKLYPFQIVIVPPGEYHQFVVFGDIESYERAVIEMYPEFLENGVVEAALSGREIISLDANDRIVNSFDYLIENASTMNTDDFRYVLGAVATDVMFMIKNYKTTGGEENNGLMPVHGDVIKYIDGHYTEQLNLNMLAEKFHFSVSLLCHTFAENYGISIKKYITQKRMNACRMELQKGCSAELVCAKYGFSNYSTFYRAYKKYFGISPSETMNYK